MQRNDNQFQSAPADHDKTSESGLGHTLRKLGLQDSRGVSVASPATAQRRFKAFGAGHVDRIAAKYGIPDELVEDIRLGAMVMPLRLNDYVLSELIDWSAVPRDPIFQLVFPRLAMFPQEIQARVRQASLEPGSARAESEIRQIREGLNPDPGGQRDLNVPSMDGLRLAGLQHKYRETVLYFPSHGQTCHAYCSFCFRWPQFVGEPEWKFATPDSDALVRYLRMHTEVSDVLVTGGDPMVMSETVLRSHLLPILDVESVQTIRIGTKSLSYWPQRFVTDPDADNMLRLFEAVVSSGRLLALMAHFTHPNELRTQVVQEAIRRVRATGALIYCQSPLISHINNDPGTLADLWRREIAAGMVPYYLFVERDTGPFEYFRVPLVEAAFTFKNAFSVVSGLARTVRGPVMSTTPGKVVVDGVEAAPDGQRFKCHFRLLQARRPTLVGRPFHAYATSNAFWLSDVRLADGTPADVAAAVGPYTAGEGDGAR